MRRPIDGFSKLSKQEKIDWLIQEYLENDTDFESVLKQYWNENSELQKLHDEFSENTISNFSSAFLIISSLIPNPNSIFREPSIKFFISSNFINKILANH